MNFLDFTCLHKQHTKGGGEKFSVPDPQNPYFNDPAACFNTNEDYIEKEIEEWSGDFKSKHGLHLFDPVPDKDKFIKYLLCCWSLIGWLVFMDKIYYKLAC